MRRSILCLAFAVVLPPTAAAQEAPPTAPPVLDVPAPVVADTFQVRRRALSLEEIIQRSIEGEKSKLAGRKSMVYTGNGRAILEYRKKKEVIDTVARTYASDDGFERIVDLGERITVYRREGDTWVLDPDADTDEEGFDVRDGGVNDFGDLPVWLESTHEFSYELLDRYVQTDRVIFKVGFRPKSDFKPLPSGVLYVDTERYRIIHEEFDFEKNPFPLIVRDLKRLSRQWEELPTANGCGRRCAARSNSGPIPSDAFRAARSSPSNARTSPLTCPTTNPFSGSVDVRALWILILLTSTAAAQTTSAPADSSETKRFLDELQRLDDAFFDEDVRQVDTSYRDSLVTQFEDLGFDSYRDASDASQRTFRWDLGPASPLWTYDRVEGLVPAARLDVRPFGPRGLRVLGDAGWATGPGALRWQAGLEIPLSRTSTRRLGLFARAEYGDRVVPFGSNRPYANSLRALIGGADEQDYLRRRGGRAGFEWRRRGALASIDYVAVRELSRGAPASFTLHGDLPTSNLRIDEGITRAIEARFAWGMRSLSPWTVDVTAQIAGGALAGDHDDTRIDALLRRRSFLGRWELQTTARWIRSFGNAPIQRLADAGGISSVRGHPRRARVGEEAIHLRAELPIPYDLLRHSGLPAVRATGIQFVPWADAARVDDEWIQSLGLGLQRHWAGMGRAANVRLDVAFPVGPARPADVVFLLRFAGP